MEISERLSQIHEYYFSKKLKEIDDLKKAGKDIISLAIGSPDAPPHPDVVQTLHDEALKPNAHGYPSYRGTEILRRAFSEFYKNHYHVDLDPETEVLPLIGSKEGIFHLCMSYLNPGDEALIPGLGYATYRAAVLLSGATPVEFSMEEKNSYFPDFTALEATDLSKVKLMWVNYPNMPTGQMPTVNLFEYLIAFGKKHNILICHDNPYSFILNDHPMSLLSIPGAKETAVELNSLSKSHNMPGWRIGMLAARKDIATDILRFKSNIDTGMFNVMQVAAAKALALPDSWYADLNSEYRKRRVLAHHFLDALNCGYNLEHSGMFVWAKIPDHYKDAFEITDKILYELGIFITPGQVFGSSGDRFVRVSLCAPVPVFEKAIDRVKVARWS
jgi:aspartate/methionine/tyrosine aminotransferase